MISVLLVDDQPAVRHGLRLRLAMEPDITIAGEADNGATALALAEQLRPRIVLMDVEMPVMDGITATTTLQATLPDCAVIMLSLYADQATRQRAAAAGAAAFVEKQAGDTALLMAIRVIAGDRADHDSAPHPRQPP